MQCHRLILVRIKKSQVWVTSQHEKRQTVMTPGWVTIVACRKQPRQKGVKYFDRFIRGIGFRGLGLNCPNKASRRVLGERDVH